MISNREQLGGARPLGELLVIEVLHYAAELKPREEFEKLVDDGKVSAAELKLAKTLITSTDRAGASDIANYRDLYNDRLRELVEAKVEGREVATAPSTKIPPTINLIEALKESLGQTKRRGSRRQSTKPTTRRLQDRLNRQNPSTIFCRFSAPRCAGSTSRTTTCRRRFNGFCAGPILAAMPLSWSVRWFADAAGFQVCVCNRCRIVVNFRAESLSGE